MRKTLISILLITTISIASNIKPINATTFLNNGKKIHLKGKKFIVISLKDKLFFAVNKKGRTEFFGEISSGKKTHPTPIGNFNVLYKERHHMSTIYDSNTGINNMNYMLKITNDGIALHEGPIEEESMGCVHINPMDAPQLYNWTPNKTRVIILKNSYLKYYK